MYEAATNPTHVATVKHLYRTVFIAIKKGPVLLSSESQRSQSEEILSSFAAPFTFKPECEVTDKGAILCVGCGECENGSLIYWRCGL